VAWDNFLDVPEAVERCLESAPRWRSSIIMGLMRIDKPPPKAYVGSLLDAYDLGERWERNFREQHGIR